jgi:2'-5' RNA ligase superfamily
VNVDPEATETAVIVAVTEAEAAVGRHRKRLDASASWGLPAHVTVLYPFVLPAALDTRVLVRLAEAVLSVPAFGFVFATTRWFDEDVLWLAPEPDGPFRGLTNAVWRVFPECPPYGGEYTDLDPHLSIGFTAEASLDDLKAAELDVRARLPLRAQVDSVVLMAGARQADSWRVVRELPLGK